MSSLPNSLNSLLSNISLFVPQELNANKVNITTNFVYFILFDVVLALVVTASALSSAGHLELSSPDLKLHRTSSSSGFEIGPSTVLYNCHLDGNRHSLLGSGTIFSCSIENITLVIFYCLLIFTNPQDSLPHKPFFPPAQKLKSNVTDAIKPSVSILTL